MSTNLNNVYIFLRDENKRFYRAIKKSDGTYVVSSSKQPYPIEFSPANMTSAGIEFGTNNKYNSLVRSIQEPLEFIKDGAAILRELFLLGKGTEEKTYISIVKWDGATGLHELCYSGKIDYNQKSDDTKINKFTVSTIDDTAWGILSDTDSVEFAIDCSPTNPKAIKVLFDGTTLLNRYTYQTVQAPIIKGGADNSFTVPFVLVNQDGDSSGIVTKSQGIESTTNFTQYAQTSKNWFLSTFYQLNNFNINGSFKFTWNMNVLPSGGIQIFFMTSTGQKFDIFSQLGGNLTPGKIYDIPFNITMNLAPGESIFFFCQLNSNAANLFTVTPIVTNIFVSTKTVTQPVVAYGLRPIDVLKDIVSQATRGRYTIESDFFTVNNKDILFAGDNIRGVPNSKIYTTFSDFFVSYDCLYFIALRNVNGILHIELADVVYNKNQTIFDLGEAIELKTIPATDLIFSSVVVGSPKQDYRHASGRLEFNSENVFSFNITSSLKKMDLVPKYRQGCMDIIFLILDYQGLSTKDNNGDKSVYMAQITDNTGSAVENIETFVNINVDNAALAPIIKSPLNNDIVNFDKPFLEGIGIPGNTVNIYIESTLDGNAVVDVNGNWSYQIQASLPSYDPGVADGISIINATYTDMLGALDTISIVSDTTTLANILITYPQGNDSLYNNKPLIKGTAPNGTNIDISIDGIVVGSVVTDNSCRWKFKIVTPITNGSHIVSINAGTDSESFTVDSFTSFPLITYVGSELDGFIIINNMPLIEGVGIPGTTVNIYLNYVSYAVIGTTVVDANGNWSFQAIPVTYPDPLSGIPTVLVPIRNGASIISTSLINKNVGINVIGFLLNRPAYSSITGVVDNTVFNTNYSPKRQLLARKSFLSGMLNNQRNGIIKFQKADKNGSLSTVLAGVNTTENTNINISSLGTPFAMFEYAEIKVQANTTFAKALYNFNAGGLIKCNWRGKDLYFLPWGSMKMKSVIDSVQEWKLLFSPATSYFDLLSLYKNGITVNLMKNSFHHSDYNSMHAVEYDFQRSPKYNQSTIYQDWFRDRNDQWLLNPEYMQKFNRGDVIRDQILTNGISDATLEIYRCFDASLIDTKVYNAVGSQPVQTPLVVLEAIIDWSDYPSDQYFCVGKVNGTPVMIFERVHTKDNWKGTFLIESTHTENYPMFFYSTGIVTVIRVEGTIKKLLPSIVSNVSKQESGNTTLLYGNVSRKRVIRFGTAYGLPDYLYLKIADALLNDNFNAEGVAYTITEGEQVNPSEDVSGHPLYYYQVMMDLKENNRGKIFLGVPGGSTEGVTLVVDPLAIGLPAGPVININLV